MAFTTAITLALVSTAASVAAQGLGAFVVPDISSHQPDGVKDGQVDYYYMAFDVNSMLGGSNHSGYCHVTWSDNLASSSDAYSDYVPTGYTQCDSSSANFGDGDSEFTFQLFPYYSIGNWSFQVQQTYAGGIATSVVFNISNTTTAYDYSCTIYPYQTSASSGVGQHASGDCSLASNETFVVPVQSISAAPTSSSVVATSTASSSTATSASLTSASASATAACTASVAFPVLETTRYGQTVLVTGNITELSDWSTSSAIALNANQYTSSYHLWNGTVSIPAGTPFEYKYILRGTRGSITWETGSNRVYTVPASACGEVAAGSNPDKFRH